MVTRRSRRERSQRQAPSESGDKAQGSLAYAIAYKRNAPGCTSHRPGSPNFPEAGFQGVMLGWAHLR
jgi:hypothetical protein